MVRKVGDRVKKYRVKHCFDARLFDTVEEAEDWIKKTGRNFKINLVCSVVRKKIY